MKKNLLIFAIFAILISSCKQNKTEIGLKYHDTIVNIQMKAIIAFEEVLDSSTEDIAILIAKQENAKEVTKTALEKTKKIASIEYGEDLNLKSLNLIEGIQSLLYFEIQKIIEIREELNKIYDDELVDELNEIILKSHNHIDSLIFDFNKTQIDFGNHYNFELIEDDELIQ